VKLGKLERLSLQSNRLTELPIDIHFLRKLKYLNLEYNRLRWLPPNLKKLNKLEELNLNHNIGLKTTEVKQVFEALDGQ
jgi:Leucine-rich repeat (LRR) protein